MLFSHLSHFLSVLVLRLLVIELGDPASSATTRLAFWTAVLHILSPAGLFLSAPYGESHFSFLSFLGFLFYVRSRNRYHRSRDIHLIASGVCFALATTIRSNGLLNASVFLYDAVAALPSLPRILTNFDLLLHLGSVVVAGCLVAIGAALPQWIAFDEFCSSAKNIEFRPWCNHIPPSIYTWAQSHYW